jgi:hypothetical protein
MLHYPPDYRGSSVCSSGPARHGPAPAVSPGGSSCSSPVPAGAPQLAQPAPAVGMEQQQGQEGANAEDPEAKPLCHVCTTVLASKLCYHALDVIEIRRVAVVLVSCIMAPGVPRAPGSSAAGI